MAGNREHRRPWLIAELCFLEREVVPAHLQWVLICKRSRPHGIRISDFSKELKISEFLYETSGFLKHGGGIFLQPLLASWPTSALLFQGSCLALTFESYGVS